MKGSDIVQQLARYLPTLVDDFTTNVSVTTLTQAAGVATATTSTAHGLSVGDQVNMIGTQAPIVISSLTRSGTTGTLVTATDHDLTSGLGEIVTEVEISGATEAEFNGSFEILNVNNRREITFSIADAGATTATGTPLLLNGSNVFNSYGGLIEITGVPTTTTFEYAVNSSLYSPASGTITAKTQPRVSHAVNPDAILQAYTEQPQGDAWAFVFLGDAIANKSRRIDLDATDNIQSGQFYNQRLIQNLTVHVYIPSADTIAGAQARDRAQELLKPIMQCLGGFKPQRVTTEAPNPLQITGHRPFAYTHAFYVHEYTFETVVQLSGGDIFVPNDDVAFRDIAITETLSFGTEQFTTNIDLDEQPL